MTKSVRAVFMHNSRLADLVLTLKFDRNLIPLPDYTIIYYGPHDATVDYLAVLNDYDIDCSALEIVPDWHLWGSEPLPIDLYRYGGWIAQQLIKLMAVDHLCHRYDLILIQDCDTFNIKPYHWVDNDNRLQLYALFDTSQSPEYYSYVEQFTGQPRQTQHCLVSEFMPISKQSWFGLKAYLERGGQNWLKTFDMAFSQNTNEQIWFSEYELLGNWNLWQDQSVSIIEQKRFELSKNWQKKLYTLSSCNVIANCSAIDLDDIDYWVEKFHSISVDT